MSKQIQNPNNGVCERNTKTEKCNICLCNQLSLSSLFPSGFSPSSYVYGLCTRFDVGKESPSASCERSLCPTVFFFSLRTETVSLKEKHEGDNFYGIVLTRSSLNWRVGQISLTFFAANSCLGKRTHGSAAD